MHNQNKVSSRVNFLTRVGDSFAAKSRVALIAGLLASGVGAVWADTPAGAAMEVDVVPARVEPIRTAPPSRPNVLSAQDVEALQGARPRSGNRAATGAAPTSEAAAPAEVNVPWVLAPEQHPWPLHYRDPAPLNVLYLNIPSLEEARLMLPGRAADMLERAQFDLSKYINDAVGHAAQFRGAQLEAMDVWIERTLTQQRTVPQDPWAQYQFNRQARQEMLQYRDKLTNQGAAGLQQVHRDVQLAVERITPIIEVMPTHELSMGWYNALVQLRNGFALYQAQVQQGDRRVLIKADDFLARNPAVAQPAGAPPQQPRPGLSGLEAIERPAVPAATVPSMSLSAPTGAPAPFTPIAAESEDRFAGFLVVLGMFGVVGFMFLKLRKSARSPKS